MTRIPSLNALQTFVAVVEAGSQQVAADQLCLTKSAVSHTLKKLEDSVGYPLLLRRGRQLALSDQGQVYYNRVRSSLNNLLHATEQLSGHASQHTVRLTCVPVFYDKWLRHRLGAFKARYPQIKLHVHVSNSLLDLREAGFDFGIRFGLGQWLAVRSHPLLAEALVPVCSPVVGESIAHASRLGAPGPQYLGVSSLPDLWSRWCEHHEPDVVPSNQVAFHEDYACAIQACIHGGGVLLCPQSLCADDLKHGRLITVRGYSAWRIPQAFFLAERVDQSLNDEARVFRSWLLALATLENG